jgi:hypothetical protein
LSAGSSKSCRFKYALPAWHLHRIWIYVSSQIAPLTTTHQDEVIFPSELEETIEEAMAIAKHTKAKNNNELSISASLQPMTAQERIKFSDQLAIFQGNADFIPSVSEANKIFRKKPRDDPAHLYLPGISFHINVSNGKHLVSYGSFEIFTAESAILGDMKGLGKKLQVISALAFINKERASKRNFGPALPSIVICSAASITDWHDAIRRIMYTTTCKLYTADSKSTTLTKAILADPESKNTASTVYITTCEFLRARHGQPGEDISGCFSLAILDDVETLGDEKTQKWQTLANLRPRYWVFIVKPPIMDWHKNLSSILALIRPDTLWDDLKLKKTVNVFDLAPRDTRFILVVTCHTVRNFTDPDTDEDQRLKMLKQVYGQVMLL